MNEKIVDIILWHRDNPLMVKTDADNTYSLEIEDGQLVLVKIEKQQTAG